MGEGYQIGRYVCVFVHQLYSRVEHQPGMVANPARGEQNMILFYFFKGEGERRRGQLRGMSPGNLFQASSPTVHRDANFSSRGQLKENVPGESVSSLKPYVGTRNFPPIIRDPWYFVSGRPLVARSDWGAI